MRHHEDRQAEVLFPAEEGEHDTAGGVGVAGGAKAREVVDDDDGSHGVAEVRLDESEDVLADDGMVGVEVDGLAPEVAWEGCGVAAGIGVTEAELVVGVLEVVEEHLLAGGGYVGGNLEGEDAFSDI